METKKIILLISIFLLVATPIVIASLDLNDFTQKVTKIKIDGICLAEERLLGDFDSDICKEKEKEKEVEVSDKLNIMQNADGVIRVSFE